MGQYITVRLVTLSALLLGSLITGLAGADELCKPFRGGKVDPKLVQTMLEAAEDGHLYRMKPASSRIGFCVDSEFARVEAEFRDFQGGLALWPDRSGKNQQALVSIKVASLDTDGSIIEHMLKSKRFFDVINYPEILFVSTALDWMSQTRGELRGDLTLHGITRPVIFSVLMTGDKDEDGVIRKIVVRAGATISRSAFGMDTLSQLVDDSVDLCMTVEAIRHGN
ncbi:MAG: YceI family protein, partial [Gammaproteobacteria bacterium]